MPISCVTINRLPFKAMTDMLSGVISYLSLIPTGALLMQIGTTIADSTAIDAPIQIEHVHASVPLQHMVIQKGNC